MTTEELAELFLTHLYDLSEAAPHPNFMFSVNDFAPSYGVSSPEDLEKALNLLSDRGLIILAGFDAFGGISAGITIDGSVFVEKGGATGIIPRYRINPGEFTHEAPGIAFAATLPEISEPAHSPLADIRPPVFARRTIDGLFQDMEEILSGDKSLSGSEVADAIADLTALRAQISRSKRNSEILSALTSNLSAIPSISLLVSALLLLTNRQ
jgi:hypothetical protein